MPVTLVRHTTPKVVPDTCYGRIDLDVADTFVEESTAVLSLLADVDRVVSSPLQRCLKLAALISETFGVSSRTDERIMEFDFGAWEGLSWSEIPRDEIALADYSVLAGHTVLVTHSGVIRAAMAHGDTIDDFDTKVAFGGVVRYNLPGADQP